MILRSGRMIGSDAFYNNFSESSKKWLENKIYLGLGLYKYKLHF